jgi:HEAT repeat protein
VTSWITALLSLAIAAPANAELSPEERSTIVRALAGMAADDAGVRAQSSLSAGSTHLPLFIDPLIAKAESPEAAVRAAAVTALGELGVPDRSRALFELIGALMRATNDSDDEVSEAAIAALGRYPFPEVRMRLEKIASDQQVAARRRIAAAAALGAANEEAKIRLIAWLELSSREARKIPPAEEKGDPLIFAARDLLSKDRRRHLPATQLIATWPKDQEALPFLRTALASREILVRRAAATALAASTSLPSALALAGSISDPDTHVRHQAIAGLARSRDPELVRVLVGRLGLEKDAALKKDLMTAIAQQDEEPVLSALSMFDHRTSDEVRAAAIELAGVRTATRASELLARYLIDAKNEPVAQRAASYLAVQRDAKVVPSLLSELERSAPATAPRRRLIASLKARPDPTISERALKIIGGDKGDRMLVDLVKTRPEARAGLLALAGGDNTRARALALEAIEELRGPDVLEAVAKAVHHDARDDHAFNLLLEQRDQDLLPPLLELLASKEHLHRYPALFQALDGRTDERITSPVLAAAISSPELASEAIALLEQQAPRQSVPALAQLAAQARFPTSIRARALKGLAKLDSGDAETLIKPLAKDPALEVRMAARNALHQIDPLRYPEWDPYGRIPLVVEAGAFGTTMMLLAADLADAELSPVFTGAVGLVLGGATPFLLTLNEDVTIGDAGYFGTVALYGTLGGWGLGGAFGLTDQNVRWATLGGEVLGLTVAGLTMKNAEWSVGDAALANAAAVEAGFAAAALTSLLRNRELERREPISAYVGMAAAAFSTVPMALFARRLEVEDNLLLMGTMMAHGAFLGALAPGIFDRGDFDAGRSATAMIVGQGAGFFAGLVLSQTGELDARGAAFSAIGALSGAALAGGTGLAFEGLRGRPAYALAEAGAAAGALALFLAKDWIELHDNDRELISYAAIGGFLAGGQFSVRLEEKTFDQPSFPGGLLLGAGAGTLGGILLSQLVDLTDKTMYTTLGGAGLFGLSGIGLGYLVPNLGVRPRSTITGAFIAGGLALTAPFAESIVMTEPGYAYLTLAAASGAAIGALSPTLWNDANAPGDQHGGGLLFGATAGAALAIGVAQFLDLRFEQVGVASLGTVAGASIGAGLGLLVPSFGARSTSILAQSGTLLGLAGTTALLASGLGSGDQETFFAGSSLLTAHGVLHGAMLPFLWHDDYPSGREIAGGGLFGGGLGFALGAALSELTDEPISTLDLAEASMISGTADALGWGIGMLAEDRRAGAVLVQSLGIGSYAAALALSPYTEWNADDAFTLFYGAAALGILGGALPYTFEHTPNTRRASGGAIAGTSLGLLGASAYAQLVPQREIFEASSAFAASMGIAGGLALAFPELGSQRKALLIESTGGLALLAGVLLTPYTEYTSGDAALMTAATALGAWHGAWLPALHRDGELDKSEVGGGALFGASTGLLAGAVLAQFVDPDQGDVGETFLLTSAFAATGGGMVLSVEESGRRDAALVLHLTSALGLGISALAAPYTEYSANDLRTIVLFQLAGLYHGALLPRTYVDRPNDRSYGGGGLLGAGAGTLVGTLVSQLTEIEALDQLESVFFMAAGDLLGGGVAFYREDRPGRAGTLMFELGGSALLGAGLLLAPYTEFDAGDRVFTSMGALFGAWHGAFLPMVLGARSSRDHRQTLGGAMLGAGLGTLAFGAISQAVSLEASDQLEGALGFALASMIGGGLGFAADLSNRDRALLIEGTGIAGLTAGLLLSSALQIDESGDLALLPVAAGIGAAMGATMPMIFGDDPRDGALGGGALLGAGLFGAGALALTQFTAYQPDDVAELAAWSLIGGGLGAGLGFMIPDSDRALQLGLMNGASLLAIAGSLALAPFTEVGDGDFSTIGLTAAIGAAMGGASPGLWHPRLKDAPPREIGGGALFGSALGVGGGLLLTQLTDFTADDREYAAVGASMGALGGGGLGLLASKDDRLAIGLAEGLTLAGAITVAATGNVASYDAGDLAFGSAYVGYLTWHTLGLTLLLDGTDRQAAGAAMATVGLGALTGMYLAPYIQLDVAKVLMLFAGNVWGTWIGGWGGAILRDHLDRVEGRKSTGLTLISTVLGSDIGLTVTGLVVGGLLDVRPTRFAIINLSGLGGMMLGMLGAGFAKGEPLKAGNVIGSLTGLALGAVVTSFIDFEESPTWDELLAANLPAEKKADENAVAGAQKNGKLLQVESWFPSASVEPGLDGEERYMFSVIGTWQ